MQEARGPGCFHHHDAFACIQTVHRFPGILRAGLGIGGTAQHVGASRVEHIQVIVIGGSPERVSPKQIGTAPAAFINDGVVSCRTETVDLTALAVQRADRQPATGKIALPGARGAIVFVTGISCRGEVKRASSGDCLHCPGDDSILKGCLTEVGNIVHNDIAASRPQIEDVLGKVAFAMVGRREKQLCVRSQIVNQLQHGGAFTGGREAALAWQDFDLRQLALCHGIG